MISAVSGVIEALTRPGRASRLPWKTGSAATRGRRQSCGKVAHFFEGIFTVWELVKSGGWMMLPIILSSVAALGIIVERLWTLRASRVTPEHLLG